MSTNACVLLAGGNFIFVICSALRLVRFTADIYITNKPIDKNEYFTGVPSPAAAGLILLPLLYFLNSGWIFKMSI